MTHASSLALRFGSNPNHHLWNNNGTWWLHYTEHLADYTKRRVRRSLHTHNVRAARAIRDVLLADFGARNGSYQHSFAEAA
jgi:hypothetical protein